MQVRTTLLKTSCAVSVQPEVWQCVRSDSDSRVRRLELRDQLRPQQPGGPQLGDLHEEVHPDRPEERQPRRERVDVQPGRDAGPQVLHPVRERVRQLQVGRRPGLLDVVAGDGDRVELRHPPRGELEDVADDPHRRLRRVDVGVADHELLEDVVLDGPGQLLGLDPLLLGRDDVEREDRQHRTVHGHRDRHPVERDAVEQLPHVVDRVDGDAGHAHVADHPRVVAVVAAVRRQVERDGQTLLPHRQVAAVERVGLRGGGEPGVLADGPGLGDVHGRVRAAQVRHDARVGLQEVQAVEVGGRVERRDRDRPPGSPRPAPAARSAAPASARRSVAFEKSAITAAPPAGRRSCGARPARRPRCGRTRPRRSRPGRPARRAGRRRRAARSTASAE